MRHHTAQSEQTLQRSQLTEHQLTEQNQHCRHTHPSTAVITISLNFLLYDPRNLDPDIQSFSISEHVVINGAQCSIAYLESIVLHYRVPALKNRLKFLNGSL